MSCNIAQMNLTKWQSWWSIHPMIRTFISISSPLFIPWNMTARNPKRYPSGGSNTGGSVQIERICGFTQPFGLINVAEFKISPFGPTRCNETSDTRLWFHPVIYSHWMQGMKKKKLSKYLITKFTWKMCLMQKCLIYHHRVWFVHVTLVLRQVEQIHPIRDFL